MLHGFIDIEELSMASNGKDEINIFVYGTLMQGEQANAFLSHARFMGEYCLKDYALYDLGWFPGIQPQTGSIVHGEVYQVDIDTLFRLDEYEGEGRLYHRIVVRVENQSEKLYAHAYVYAKEIFGEEIKGGSWKSRQ